MATGKKKPLGEKLLEEGLITREQLREALQVQTRTGEFLGRILVKLGMVAKENINLILGIDDLAPKEEVDTRLLNIVPEQLIRKYKLFPVRQDGKKLFIAMADPLNVVAIDDLRLLTGLDIEPLVATEKDINAKIDKYYGMPEVEKALQELGIETEPEITDEEAFEETIVDEAPVIRLVNSLLMKAVDEEASDIHIEVYETNIRVRFRVDGLLMEIMSLPRKMMPALVSRIKVMSNMDIAERRVPQDGRIPLKLPGRDLDLRVSTMPTVFGEKVVIRILDKGSIKGYTLETLGFSSFNRARFEHFLKSPFGMLLVTGPTGSGKTTTLYTALNAINTVDKNIITVEDPVEYMLDGINQGQVNAKAGATFAAYLRSILRQDPDIIMVGEIRDFETAEIGIRAATTGHLVLSTLHTNDAPGSITRLIDMGVEPFMVASSVLGVVAQRLVRRICPRCKTEYQPDQAEAAFAGIKPGDVVYTGRGCEYCHQTGYRGRAAIHEVLALTPPLQSAILQRGSTEELRQKALAEGMVSLKQDGINKVLSGLTTIREVMRVAYREDE